MGLLAEWGPHDKHNLRGKLRQGTSTLADAQYNSAVVAEAVASRGAGNPNNMHGSVWLPGDSFVTLDSPVRVPSGVQISGLPGLDGTRVHPVPAAGGIQFLMAADSGACPHGPALLASGEDWSLNLKRNAEGAGLGIYRFLDYGQVGVRPRNWTSFNWEHTFQLISAPVSNDVLMCIGGRRTITEGYTVAFQAYVNAARALVVLVRLGGLSGTTHILNTANSAITVGTTYGYCVDYDGTTLRLWVGTPGTTATLVESIAATGVFTAKAYEVMCLGAAAYESYPEAPGVIQAEAPAYHGWHRFGPTSKRPSAYTIPNAPVTPANDDWVNFHCTTNGTHGAEVGELYMTKNRNTRSWLRLQRQSYTAIQYCGIDNITIYGSGYQNNISIFGSAATRSNLRNIRTAYSNNGILFYNNCYLSEIHSVEALGGMYDWGGPADSAIWANCGVYLGGASGVMQADHFKIEGFAYGIALGYTSVRGGNIWCVHCFECTGLFKNIGHQTLTNIQLSDEGNTVKNDYMALFDIHGLGEAMQIDSFIVEAVTDFGGQKAVPIGVAAGADVFGGVGNALNLRGLKVSATSAHTEIIHFLNPDLTRPVHVDGSVHQPANVPWSLTPGKVVVDGVSAPVALTDANATIYWFTGALRALATGTLTSSKTVSVEKAVDPVLFQTVPDLARMRISWGLQGYDYVIKNGVAGVTIFTAPAGTAGWTDIRMSSGEWTVAGEAYFIDRNPTAATFVVKG